MLNRIKSWWHAFNEGQRVIIILGMYFVFATIGICWVVLQVPTRKIENPQNEARYHIQTMIDNATDVACYLAIDNKTGEAVQFDCLEIIPENKE